VIDDTFAQAADLEWSCGQPGVDGSLSQRLLVSFAVRISTNSMSSFGCERARSGSTIGTNVEAWAACRAFRRSVPTGER
jgi:hypothetical protein